jgi:hypothetical protein
LLGFIKSTRGMEILTAVSDEFCNEEEEEGEEEEEEENY